MGVRSIPAKHLRADCTVLERAVLTARLATKESLAAHRPGGAENQARDATGWLAYYRYLHRLHAKDDASAFSNTLSREAADAAVMDALRGKPISVRRVGGNADAPPIAVYPKSLDALLHIHALDRQLAYMTEMHERLVHAKTAEAMELLPRVVAELSYTYSLLCWIVTHPEPGMPYDPTSERPSVPEWILALEPWDVIRICETHQRHLLRLQAVSALIDNQRQSEDGGQRPSWSMFAALAAEMFGEPVEVVMRDRSLAAQLAAMRLASAAKVPPEKESA